MTIKHCTTGEAKQWTTYLDELCHGLGKEIAIQSQEHALLMRGKLNMMVEVVIHHNTFISSGSSSAMEDNIIL